MFLERYANVVHACNTPLQKKGVKKTLNVTRFSRVIHSVAHVRKSLSVAQHVKTCALFVRVSGRVAD